MHPFHSGAYTPPVSVRKTDGVEIDLATGERLVADASNPDGDVTVVSHAHSDHLPRRLPDSVYWSKTTAALAAIRRGFDGEPARPDNEASVSLLPSGHIPGSRAALIDDGESRYCYTGDVSTRDRYGLAGFSPVDADVLIVEATYGKPEYRFPPQEDLEASILDWLSDTLGSPVVLFGYALGRAQGLQHLAGHSDRQHVWVSDEIATLSDCIERHTGITFEGEVCADLTDIGPEDVLVLPSRAKQRADVQALIEDRNTITAACSGWAVHESYRYRVGADVTFPLSDHCDYRELLDLVEAVDPDQVYTHHGFATDLARAIQSELGIAAQALKRNQHTLDDYD